MFPKETAERIISAFKAIDERLEADGPVIARGEGLEVHYVDRRVCRQ